MLKLKFAEKILKDHITLYDYNVQNDSTLELFFGLKGDMRKIVNAILQTGNPRLDENRFFSEFPNFTSLTPTQIQQMQDQRLFDMQQQNQQTYNSLNTGNKLVPFYPEKRHSQPSKLENMDHMDTEGSKDCMLRAVGILGQYIGTNFKEVRKDIDNITDLGTKLRNGLNTTLDKMEQCDQIIEYHQQSLEKLLRGTQSFYNQQLQINETIGIEMQHIKYILSSLQNNVGEIHDKANNITNITNKIENELSTSYKALNNQLDDFKRWKEDLSNRFIQIEVRVTNLENYCKSRDLGVFVF